MRLKIICFVFLLVAIISCKKKENDIAISKTDSIPPSNVDTIIPPVITSTGMICDDTVGTNWVNYNVTIEATQSWIPVYFNLDFDNDLVPDIRFQSDWIGSPGTGGYKGYSRIQSLNANTMFTGHMESDTLFRITTLNFYPLPNPPPSIVAASDYYSSCYNVTGQDTISSIKNNFRISPLDSGDSINSGFTYQSDSLTLIDEDLQYGTTNWSPDTLYIGTYHSFVSCYQFPMDTIRFIGFKKTINGLNKFGWIKMKITGKNKITIYTSAIEK